MGLAHRVVVGVVRRRHLHEAGAEAGVHMPVREDGNLAVDDGQHHSLADEGLLVGIGRRDSNARVAEHGLGTRRRHDHMVDAVLWLHERVAQIPEVTLLAPILGLIVADGRLAAWAPVHDALAAVDEPVMIPVHKDLAYGLGVLGAHRELLVFEVDGATHALDLVHDGAAVLAAPVPAGLKEPLAANLKARDALLLEPLVHLGLGGDSGVVRAEDPAGGTAAHAIVPDEAVLDGVVQRMAHVEDAGDVGGRDHDGAVTDALGAPIAARTHPCLDELGLGCLRVIGLWHLFHGASLSSESCGHVLALVS